jgi:cytochrome c biogenesis protein
MGGKQNSYGFPATIWGFFKSVKLTVFVMLTLATTSIIGTVIPQNRELQLYKNEYGAVWYNVFDLLDLFDMYHSMWFQVVLAVLIANIIVCSIDRLSSVWKIIFVKTPKFNISRFQKAQGKQEFTVNCQVSKLRETYEKAISKKFKYLKAQSNDMGFCIFAEKGRWTRLGVYFVHLSILLLVTGAMIGSIFGFDGYINIPEGEKIDKIALNNSNIMHPLDFYVECNDFNVSFYETGAPKEFRSTISIIENNKTVLKKDIIVNDPIRYKGINIFQSSYGSLRPNEVKLDFTSRKTGMVYTKKLSIGERFDLPEGLRA